MPDDVDMDGPSRLLFSAPWDPVIVRRGDALGLRALTDRFADAVAPDLSNRISDGRWVTILAWCLVRSDEIFHASGGRSVETRSEQRERYAWLRPLELMWVARTLALLPDDWSKRPLNGIRRIKLWYEDYGMKPERFGMSEAQFRAYRQTGMYGGYRLAFRKWPGMTRHGDGWTPGPATQKLADWLDIRLKEGRPAWHPHEDGNNAFFGNIRRAHKQEYRWWLSHWANFQTGCRQADVHTLPRPRDEFAALPEASLLKPLVFGADLLGKRRQDVALAIAESKATTHGEICEYLARWFADDPVVATLPYFAGLADAGMDAMDVVATVLGGAPDVALAEIARHPQAKIVCRTLFNASRAWVARTIPNIRHADTASYLAQAIHSPEPLECLRSLIEHHEIRAGGLRWFVLREGRIQARSPPRNESSRYGFRFWPLCRLAVQCGVVDRMPSALLDEPREMDINDIEPEDNVDE